MPRATIVITAHNEGFLLRRTIESCLAARGDLDVEIVIADDASADGETERLRRRYPHLRIARNRRRQGVAPARARGAARARGDTLLFLDGHTMPECGALEALVEAVEDLNGEAAVNPLIPPLDPATWTYSDWYHPAAFSIGSLITFECGWRPLEALRRRGRFYEAPALIGCAFAISRRLYRRLGGIDRHMREWGAEDIDLGLKAWLSGYPVLCEQRAVVAHRFRREFNTFTVRPEQVEANFIRVARKHFDELLWKDWCRLRREECGEELWHAAWRIYQKGRRSAERERRRAEYLRTRSIVEYARRFELSWP